MNRTEIFLKKSKLYSALILESAFSYKKRHLLIKLAEYLLFSIPIIIILKIIFSNYGLASSNELIDFIVQKLLGLTFLAIGLYILMQMFEAYFASVFYFEYIAKNNYSKEDYYTFSAGRILRKVINDNILTGLLRSQSIGMKIIRRLGISAEEVDKLLLQQSQVTNPPIFDTDNIPLIKISTIIDFIYDNYPDFQSLLASHGLNKKNLESATDWIIYNIENKEYDRRWWTRERLSRISSLGAEWSYGFTYYLNKYSRNLFNDPEVYSENISLSGRNRELEQIQAILARRDSANAVLTGAPGQEKMEVIWNLCRKIKNKTSFPNLIGKKPLLFLTSIFTSSCDNANDFENKLKIILTEALEAGNIIMVIDNFSKLILQAKQYSLNLYEIIEPYLASTEGQIIALADTEYFHSLIENDQALMSRFETVQTKPLLPAEIEKIVAREAITIENIYEIFFTYQAITEIAKSAELYFPDGVSSDKARDLLAEISPWAISNGLETIGKDEVLDYIEEKTNIPTSMVKSDEKEKLLNLENLLMKRVIAQKEAIFSISNAIRRGRAGIRNENRPLGSFLFLGPTGVGKTETAKALAETLFNNEDSLLRLDMSEYQNSESLARLIGSRENNTQGILSNMLREHPYGVLLLDEFEKTNKDVLNLFLQIIDEGYFSDVTGKKVIARNIMFIATSNAGAEKIFEIVSKGENLKEQEQEIITHIINRGIFRPELLNRFDANILFHPLSKQDQSEIARLMLQKVAKRLAEKGMTMQISADLIKFIAEGGYNPTFGARPMNRLIQDTVEQHLADLIIRGTLGAGKTVNFKVISSVDNKNSLEPIIS